MEEARLEMSDLLVAILHLSSYTALYLEFRKNDAANRERRNRDLERT